MDEDADDALGRRKPDIGPGLAAVDRLVDAVADGDGITGPAFAGSDPINLRVGRIEGDGADRLDRLLVEQRLERRSAVFRLPHAARGRAHEQGNLAVFFLATGD